MDTTNPRVDTLIQALPYIQRFAGTTMVIKFGGNAMSDESLTGNFARDVVLLHSVGIHPIVVHGGGPQIRQHLSRLKMETAFVDGHRVTDAPTLEVVRMVLVGKVNREIVGAINAHGEFAIGLSGEDAGLLKVVPRHPALGFVGDVSRVNSQVLRKLISEGFIPVIASIGVDAAGQAYNINADLVAGAIAGALSAEKLIMLTDVDGLLAEVSDPTSRIAKVSVAELEDFVASGRASEGMLPKLEACMIAAEGGAVSAHLINGTQPHALLVEIFTDAGAGTMIVSDSAQAQQIPGDGSWFKAPVSITEVLDSDSIIFSPDLARAQPNPDDSDGA